MKLRLLFDGYADDCFQDIRFRGIFNYRWLRFFGVICLSLSQYSVVLQVAEMLAGVPMVNWSEQTFAFLQSLGQLSFPFLLISTFSRILQKPERILPTILFYAVMAFAVYLLTLFLVKDILKIAIDATFRILFEEEDLIGIGNSLMPMILIISPVLAEMGLTFFGNYNVFLDLLICTLFYYFCCGMPKNATPRKIKLFRRCAVLPLLYWMASVTLSTLRRMGVITFGVPVTGLLVFRKVPTFILFFCLVLIIQFQNERVPVEDYRRSRLHSFQFSLILSMMLGLICMLDLLLTNRSPVLTAMGFGTSSGIYRIIPFILLFSYNKPSRVKWLDGVLPVYYTIHYAILYFIIFTGCELMLHQNLMGVFLGLLKEAGLPI